MTSDEREADCFNYTYASLAAHVSRCMEVYRCSNNFFIFSCFGAVGLSCATTTVGRNFNSSHSQFVNLSLKLISEGTLHSMTGEDLSTIGLQRWKRVNFIVDFSQHCSTACNAGSTASACLAGNRGVTHSYFCGLLPTSFILLF